MLEKRRSNRSLLQIKLSISDIYNQENNGIHNLDSPIEVTDISTHGIGLISECILPLSYFFDATLTLGPSLQPIHTVVKIIRVDVIDKDTYIYGCEFKDLSEENTNIIKSYCESCS